MQDAPIALFALAIALSYVYAFVGGFTDAANAIATSVGTRVLSPLAAVSMAAVFNLLGGLTGTAVAETIGKDLLDPEALSLHTVVAGVAGSMVWSLLTYAFGIPVSETHGLIGGLTGAALVSGGASAVKWKTVGEVGISIFASPALGFLAGAVVILCVYWLCRGVSRPAAMPWFVNLQRLSAAFMSFSHGRNDAQKPMGVLALALALESGEELNVATWIVVSCSLVAAAGTFSGGWKIVRTVGDRVAPLDPVKGFAAEISGASVLQVASAVGIPVSTTHAITASIMGVAATRRRRSVRWPLLLEIFASWMLTVPAAMLFGALFVWLLRAVF